MGQLLLLEVNHFLVDVFVGGMKQLMDGPLNSSLVYRVGGEDTRMAL